jgi:hypothetical protein
MRLPGSVLTVLANIALHTTQILMINVGPDCAAATGNDGVLVNLHVALGPLVLFNVFIFASSHSEECQLAKWIATAKAPSKEMDRIA